MPEELSAAPDLQSGRRRIRYKGLFYTNPRPLKARLQRRCHRKPGNHKFQWTQILDINASVPKSAKKAVQQQGIFQSKLSCRDDYIGKEGLCTENEHEAHLG